jgi:glucose-1-phosphate thymidylyltransferase
LLLKAIIPVAGVGSRLRPHTFTLPKVLLNVAGKPILGHILDHLSSSGISQITLIVGHMAEQVEDYVRSNCKIPAEFIVQEEPKGLAHAVSLGLNEQDREVLVILGDTIFEIDLRQTLKTMITSALGVKEVSDPRRFGVVETRNGLVDRLVEKPENPTSNLVLVGIYLVRNAALLRTCIRTLFDQNLTTRGEYQLTDALQLMIEKGETFQTFPVSNWYDCGKPDMLLATNRHLLETQPPQPARSDNDSVIVPPVYIHPDAVLERAVVGPYATIGASAVVRDAMVRDSILGDGAHVENCLVERSIVGNKSTIIGQFHRYNLGDSSEIIHAGDILN